MKEQLGNKPSKASQLAELWLELVIAGVIIFMLSTTAFATTTKVGNGDDGGDLEGLEKVKTGVLVETRDKAVEKLKALKAENIEHLGALIPEVQKSEIFLVRENIKPKLKQDKGMESSPDQTAVYARTFAEPHAATRFFPQALLLTQDQLIALHIHEGLHRALPVHVREDEEVVTAITLAITAPDSNFDRVNAVVQQQVKPPQSTVIPAAYPAGAGATTVATKVVPEAPDLVDPSSVTYSYRSFFQPKTASNYPIQSMHLLQSNLYPFGYGPRAFGIGLGFSYIQLPERSIMGPLNLSARMRITTLRGFDVGVFGSYSMNTLSDDELKNSPVGRDVATVGLSARHEGKYFYSENFLTVSPQGTAKQKIGNITYEHEYGAVTAAIIRVGGRYSGIELGGFGELLVSDSYKVSGGAFRYDSGRYRIFSAGPELALNYKALRLGVAARWVLDATPGINLDHLGDIMGHGMGQGFVNSSLSLRF